MGIWCKVRDVHVPDRTYTETSQKTPHMKRRHFLGIAGVLLAGTAGGLCKAQAQEPTALDFYRLGITALRRGLRFENAAKNLEQAVKLSPERAEYQLALGCAYASRAASLASAAEQIPTYQSFHQEYPARLKAWQDAQKNPKSSDYNTPTPFERILKTPDDEQPFTLSADEAAQAVKTLAAQAVAAFDKGVVLCDKSNTETRADAQNIRAWGIALLRKYKLVRDQTLPSLAHQQILDAWTNCIALVPDNASYWQARGAARFPLFMRDDNTDTSAHAEPKADEYAEGISDFQHALSLRPKNFDVLYQLSLVMASRDEAASLEYLKKAVALKPSNAVLGYYLGERLLIQAKKTTDVSAKKALQTAALGVVEQAATARQMVAEKVVLPVPENLQAAWNFNEAYANNQDYRVVLRVVVEVKDIVEDSKDTEAQMAWVRCMLRVGLSETDNYQAARAEGSTASEAKSAQYLRYTIGASAYGLGVALADLIKNRFKGDATFARFLSDAQATLKAIKKTDDALSSR